jgi:hypothetical protein
MKFSQVETTWVCQLNKPENRTVLEGYKARKRKSGKELSSYYRDVINMLQTTEAWGVSGVNKFVNELGEKVRATLAKAKNGKTHSYAHAGTTLAKIDAFKDKPCKPIYRGRYILKPLVTEAELQALEKVRA